MINEYEISQAESERRRREAEEMRRAAYVVRTILLVPFLTGLGLAVYEVTRPGLAEPLLVVLAVLFMIPFLATWRWGR